MTVCSPDSPIVEQGILLRELNHRIDNGLASAINLVSAAAVRVEGAEAKRALSEVVELLHGHADVQQALAMPKGKALIDGLARLGDPGWSSGPTTSRRNWRLPFGLFNRKGQLRFDRSRRR